MRWLAALAALLLAAPAGAQDPPPWTGVWEGKVGSYPVRACFESFGEGAGRGSYYYLSQLEAISLAEEEGEITWLERAPGSETDAFWQPSEMTATRIRGIWLQGDRQLPFDLKPVPWTESDWGGACSSAAFMEPRLRDWPQARREPAEDHGLKYVRHIAVPPAQFREDVMIESFQFDPERPGDAAINRALAAYLPKGLVSDEFADCFAGALAVHGVDGYLEKSVAPELVTAEFLGVHEASSDYCGGAHPNHGFHSRTFDRQSGREIDLFDWIGEPLSSDYGWSGELDPALLELVLARWPANPEDDQEDCREVAATTTFWDLELREKGLAFWPDVPHVALPCRAESVLDWHALTPFLDAEGRAGLARVRGG